LRAVYSFTRPVSARRAGRQKRFIFAQPASSNRIVTRKLPSSGRSLFLPAPFAALGGAKAHVERLIFSHFHTITI